MIHELQIENFKAFGSRQTVPLAPITLVYGENSAGKSSLLQSLNLLKQTSESNDAGAFLLPRADGGIVDLGSYSEMLFDHDLQRELRFRVTMPPDGGWARSMEIPDYLRQTTIGIEFAFALTPDTREISLNLIRVYLAGEHRHLTEYSIRRADKRERLIASRYWGGGLGKARTSNDKSCVASCVDVGTSERLWRPIFQAWHKERDQVASFLANMKTTDRPGRWFEEDESVSPEQWKAALDASVSFYRSDFSFFEYLERVREVLVGHSLSLEGFRPAFLVPQSPTLPEVYFYDRLARSVGNLTSPALLPRITLLASQTLSQSLGALFPLGPFRRPPQRWYIYTGSSPLNVGFRGDQLPDLLFRRPALVKEANHWLNRLQVGYELQVQELSSRSSDLFDVRLLDTRRKEAIEVGLLDVGFGISQILPFVVQCLAGEGQLISIEQPEVHIHPRLQADLGELIANCTKRPYEHRFLIETHSEHLVLRMQRLVREKVLTPDDVAILYVSRGSAGSSVTRIRLDSNGDFVDEWPNGFFPERLREI